MNLLLSQKRFNRDRAKRTEIWDRTNSKFSKIPKMIYSGPRSDVAPFINFN